MRHESDWPAERQAGEADILFLAERRSHAGLSPFDDCEAVEPFVLIEGAGHDLEPLGQSLNPCRSLAELILSPGERLTAACASEHRFGWISPPRLDPAPRGLALTHHQLCAADCRQRICHVLSPPGWAWFAASVREGSDDSESREDDERIISLADEPGFDLDRRHNPRSGGVGRPGIEPGTYGLKSGVRTPGALCLHRAITGAPGKRRMRRGQAERVSTNVSTAVSSWPVAHCSA